MARAALRDDLHGVHTQLTAQVLESTKAGADADTRVAAWEVGDRDAISRASATFEEICADDNADLARMSVALRVVRSLLDAS